jgi:hypothetical protein
MANAGSMEETSGSHPCPSVVFAAGQPRKEQSMLRYRLGFVLIGILLIAGSASAASRLYEGKIVAVSDGRIMVVDKDGDNDEFLVTSSTKIMRNGKSAKLNNLEVGDRVKINAQSKGTSLEASDIEARAAE